MNFKLKTAAAAAISAGALAGAIFASAQSAPLYTPACYQFTQNLKLGSSGVQVLELQKSLNALGFTVANTGAGSPGNETSYFGVLTKNAVIKYQEAHVPEILAPFGLTQGTGNFFAATRAYMNANCGTGGTTNPTNPTNPTTPSTGGVAVSLSPVQPNNVLVAGAARAKLADIVFSGNGSVVNVKLQRLGVSNNAALTNVYLYDAVTGVRLTDAASVLTDGSITFNNASGIFTVAGSKTVSVLADIASGTSGQSVGVSLTGYTVSGSASAVVSGLNGPALPISSATLATGDFGAITPGTTNITAGTVGATVWSSALNVGTRAVNLSSATFKMIGSAPMNSLANVKLFVDGVQFGNATAFAANGYVTFTSATPLSLNTGSHQFDVRADVVAGSSRTFYVTLENVGDIALGDSQLYGANISVTKQGSAFTGSSGQAGVVTISGGSITISQNPNFSNSSLIGGSSNQTLGSFKVNAYGEDVKVSYLKLTLATTSVVSPTTTKLNNVTVYVNGGAVTSGIQATLNSQFTASLGSNLIIPAGGSAIVEVKGDLSNENNQNVTAGGFQVQIASSTDAQGMYSYNTTNIPTSVGQTLTVSTGNVAYGATSGFTAANIAANQTGVKIASFSLQAGSSESLNVNNINIMLSGSSTPGVDYSNLKVTDGQNPIGYPTLGSNNFSVNYNVPAGTTKTIEVWVDTANAATGKAIVASSTISYRGSVSNTPMSVSATAPQMTFDSVAVATPTLVTSGTLGSRYIIGGSSTTTATFNFVSSNGNATIKDLNFTYTGSGIDSVTINGVTAAAIGNQVNFYGINLPVTAGVNGVNVPVTIKYSAVNTNGGVASEVTNTLTLASVKYVAGGSETVITPGVAANTMTLVASLPTVKKTTSGVSLGVGTSTGVKVGTVTVSADASGDVTVFQLPYSVSASNVIVKINGTDVSTIGGSASATGTVIANGYRIGAGSTATFDIYGDIYNGGTGSSNYDVSLGAQNNFKWSDIVDGKVTVGTATKTQSNLLTTYNN